MASSTFEVKESESDSEKVLDFGLDTCEENGIMSTPVDGELPKDHTYTKEPDVLEEEDLKENSRSNNQLEDNMDSNAPPAEKSKASKPAKVEKPTKRNAARGKSKKTAAKKEAPVPVPRKSRTKRDDVISDIAAVTEDLPKDVEKEESPAIEENEAPAEEPSKPARRGKKRKVEGKENLLEENSVEEPAADAVEPPKTRNASTAKEAKADKLPKKSLPSDGTIDTHNLPKGWLRKTVVRKSGKSAGLIDVYIYSPDGFKFRSKPDIAAYLHRTQSTLKLDHFDFSRRPFLQNSSVKATPAAKIPKKKGAPVKSKPSPAKKKPVSSPKKTPKLLVKIVSAMRKKKVAQKSPAKVVKASKTPVKGKKTAKPAAKDTKKKKNA